MADSASRAVVIVSALLAVVWEAVLGGREWSMLVPLTIGVLAASALLARFVPRLIWPVILGLAVLAPVCFLPAVNTFRTGFNCVWLASMIGAIIGDGGWRGWSLPCRWRAPLVYWALAVALVWPIIVFREADFYLPLLRDDHLANSGLGGPPALIAVWVLNVALTHVVGILWFDWMFLRFPLGDERSFRRRVAMPMGIGIILGCLLAAYQSSRDFFFLSYGPWAGSKRAAGSLLDGDAFGALAGFWSSAFVAMVGSLAVPEVVLGGLGVLAAWAGLWATGSRSALLSGVIGVVFVAWAALRSIRWSRTSLFGAVVALALLVGAVWAVKSIGSSHNDALSRLRESRPAMTWPAIRLYAEHNLWNRFGPFGTASVQMVRDFPVVGIGVGSFHHVFPDYAYRITGDRFFFENAQSWYRHHLAELGILGSLGWLTWCVLLIDLLIRRPKNAARSLTEGALKGTLVAIGLICAVTMPTQVAAVSLSVWMFAFWYLQSGPVPEQRVGRIGSPSRRVWTGVWGLALIYAAATAWVGYSKLRPPHRAIAADWHYISGYSNPETRDDGTKFSWMGNRSVDVFPIEGRWLRLRVSGGPPDVAERPSRLQIWARNRRIVDEQRTSSDGETWYVEAPPPGPKRMMIEIHVSRTWRPDSGETRDLGIAVDAWSFVASPPPGARVIRYVR